MHKKLVWLDMPIYSVKANSQAGNMWVCDHTKRQKLQDTQLAVSKIDVFFRKI